MTVRSVERALSLLVKIADSAEPVALSDISRSTDIDKATTLRLLGTLEQFKLIQRDPLSRRYSLGPGLWRLVHLWRNDLRKVSEPYLRSLLRATEESVQLVCPRGVERVVVQAFPGAQELCIVPAIGQALPIYVGASGKILMAFLPEEERDRIIELTGLKPVSPLGVTDRRTFLQVLQAARQQGFATSIGDVTMGASAIAAPVFDSTGRVIAAVSLRAPDIRMPPERIAQIAPRVVEAAHGISLSLGYEAKRALSA